MAVIGIDDTDSATAGMCTTYVGTLIAERLGPAATTTFLVRLHPGVEHKTRGNGAVGLRTAAPLADAMEAAEAVISTHARVSDPATNPGLVGARDSAVPDAAASFGVDAIRRRCRPAEATSLLEDADIAHRGWGNRRGLIGATAAVGAVRAFADGAAPAAGVFDDWTCEYLAYRRPSRWGTDREVDAASVHTATEDVRPRVWDNLDPVTGELACVPRTPCPVLYGIRGEDPAAVTRAAAQVDGEPSPRSRVFVTNQGTDAHVRPGTIGRLRAGRVYRVTGTVVAVPETRRGGHVRFGLSDGTAAVDCLAFEPTKRFRERVRRLRCGDRIIACGEVAAGSLKLEKFALVEPNRTERVPPTCPECDRRMKSAGRGQGYRCRRCGTRAPGKVSRRVDRELDPGWYEVPPAARRHLTKPLARTRAGST